jgi:hypothetical protein
MPRRYIAYSEKKGAEVCPLTERLERAMRSAGPESGATTTLSPFVGRTRRSCEPRERSRTARWGVLYVIFVTSVGLCGAGSRLVVAVGHSTLVEYGVALVILGLLVAWVRRSRSVLSPETPGVQARPREPFSIIHVAFSPGSVRPNRRPLAALSDNQQHIATVRPATRAPHR